MLNRRVFFTDLAKYAALAAYTPSLWRLRWNPLFADDPFTLGVAAGDPTPDGAVLWTRLAPRPLEPDGGMSGARAVVRWEVAEDEAFSRVVKHGDVTALPELGHSLHVDAKGLRSARWYFYRFTSGGAASPTGRFRTAPPNDAASPLSFAFVSCQHFEEGLFTAYGHLAREEVDLVAHLGDYIYEYGGVDNRPRKHIGLEIRSLDDYRRRYAQYKSDPLLQAAHARCAWTVIWDDHELHNNYSMLDRDSTSGTPDVQRERRAAAYQAWWEHQPVRIPRTRTWADLRIYRSTNWGRLARFWQLDGRQYRWDQACGDGSKAIPCGDWADPNRTMLGVAQTRWLSDGLARSKSHWQVLANQVVLAPPDEKPKDGDRIPMDNWAGYPANRDQVLMAVAEHARNRTVAITGDIHNNWVYDVRRGFDKPDRGVIAAEFVGTSISSGGDGGDSIARVNPAYLAARPSLKWANNRRGYVLCDVTAEEWRAQYRVVPFVAKPGAPVQTASAWRLAHGTGRLEKA
jgi:alkaline phosphatase D